jgi:hypothetical protein
MSSQMIIEAILPCVKLVDEFRIGKGEIELEARMGTFVKESPTSAIRFQPGVERANFFEIQEMLEQYTKWLNKDTMQWVDSVDYFYGNIRATATDSTAMTFIEKKSLSSVDIICPFQTYDIRIATKQEKNMQIQFLKQIPDFVRIKRRMSFEYSYTDLNGQASHVFDLTVVHSGKTKWLALNSPSNVTYEVEVEVKYIPTYFEQNKDISIASSLLEKMVDLVTMFQRNKRYSLIHLTKEDCKGASINNKLVSDKLSQKYTANTPAMIAAN